ncbi:MAG TPA: fibrinogen-like YCDxxxxGGGW domain-containing protein, partial [Nannocystaceae bacterium]|nr:fibrinogen-like YCDxxxxGGGW domain-containing protein [Nannocystaceae bacterium]
CLSTCVAATCGDGAVQAGVETCDDGNADETDTCTTLCKAPSCSDALKSGSESDVDCGGSCMACGLGGLCVDGGDCESGFCGGGTCKVAASCAALKTADPNAVSGVYTIDPDGMGGEAAYGVYCDMTTDGGGWTLVLNLDTSDGHVMWWGHALWTDSNTYGSAETAMTEDHVSAGWHNLGGGKEVLVLVHQEGATKGWKSFNKVTTDPMIVHLKGGDNVLIGSQKNSDVAGLWTQERLVRLSTNLYGNHCWQQGGLCTSGNQGSPDGDRIGSHEAIPSDNVGGGLGNWHDMNYCCNANYGSGKSCNGSAIRTASEAQAGWAPCYGGQGHFGTDTLVPSTNTCSNTTCAQANWSLKNGVDYDYAIMIR